jgi:hypothetical protein
LDSGNDFWKVPKVPCDLACVHAIEGDKDAALQWLKRGLRGRLARLAPGELEPAAGSLHSDPRFIRRMARIEADVAAMR